MSKVLSNEICVQGLSFACNPECGENGCTPNVLTDKNKIKELEKQIAESVPKSRIKQLIACYSTLEDDGTVEDLRRLLS